MSVYPHTARALSEGLAAKALPNLAIGTWVAGIVEEAVEERKKLAAEIEATITEYACRAADVAGLKDPTQIARMIWYRTDGWGHGGCAISWEERAEELEKELREARKLLEDIRQEAIAPTCASYEYDPTPTAEERLGKIAGMTKDYES